MSASTLVNDKSSRDKVLTRVKFVCQTLFRDIGSLCLRKWTKTTFISSSLVVGDADIECLKMWTKEDRLSKQGPCLVIAGIYKYH